MSAISGAVENREARGLGWSLFADGEGRAPKWNARRAVRVVLRPGPVSIGTARMNANDALTLLGAATGLRFEVVGWTDELDLDIGTLEEPGILIGWVTRAEVEGLLPEASGVGGTRMVTWSIHSVYVGGFALVDVDARVSARMAWSRHDRSVLLHELGHAVGLAHCDDPAQVMYPTLTARSPATYQSGDLEGLRQVASWR